MGTDAHRVERAERAARNQSLFREANERIRELNVALASVADTFDISCECADTDCMETIAIRPFDYAAIRADPRQFAVLPGHVDADVERIVGEWHGFVVVKKIGAGGEVAEQLATPG